MSTGVTMASGVTATPAGGVAGSFTTLTASGATTLTATGSNVPVNLWSWGIPVGVPPSGYFANNGVYVIGQAPSLSATASFSATSGSGVTMTMSAATLLGTSADVGRVLTILDTTYKYATITTQSSTTVATVTLTGTLSGTGPFANAACWLSGTPTTNTTAFSVPMPLVFTSIYLNFPAGAVAAASAAGIYYCVATSSTVLTVYNNALTSGQPTIPSSPTAFATTGAGAFTQSLSQLTLLTLAVPANSMGPNGYLAFQAFSLRNSNASSTQLQFKFGGSAFGSMNTGSVIWYGAQRIIRNNGVTNAQLVYPLSQGSGTDSSTANAAPGVLAIDTTASQNIVVFGDTITSAADFIICIGGAITANYFA